MRLDQEYPLDWISRNYPPSDSVQSTPRRCCACTTATFRPNADRMICGSCCLYINTLFYM